MPQAVIIYLIINSGLEAAVTILEEDLSLWVLADWSFIIIDLEIVNINLVLKLCSLCSFEDLCFFLGFTSEQGVEAVWHTATNEHIFRKVLCSILIGLAHLAVVYCLVHLLHAGDALKVSNCTSKCSRLVCKHHTTWVQVLTRIILSQHLNNPCMFSYILV